MSPNVVMVTPFRARYRHSSTSIEGTQQTGHPGPATISTSFGINDLIPCCIMVCSWEPHTCIILTGLEMFSMRSTISLDRFFMMSP